MKQNNNEKAGDPTGTESAVGGPKDALLQGGFLTEVKTEPQASPRSSDGGTRNNLQAGIKSAETNKQSVLTSGDTGSVFIPASSSARFPSTRTYTK